MKQALRRSRAECAEAEEADGHLARMPIIEFLPKGFLLVYAIGRHVALQVICPCQHGFRHHA
ncbi:hypothetical protein D3C80_2187840 [compost metagenome]